MSATYPAVPQEWDKAIVTRYILARQLAPFYRGLQDEWDPPSDDEDEDRTDDSAIASDFSFRNPSMDLDSSQRERSEQKQQRRKLRLIELETLLNTVGAKEGQEVVGDQCFAGRRGKEPAARRRAEVEAYERGTAECPICMLCVALTTFCALYLMCLRTATFRPI